MTRYIATITKEKVVFRKINKINRSLTMVGSRLYRTDDALCVADAEKADCFVLYDLDEQQPYGRRAWLDPDFTKALIDSLKLGKGKIDKPMLDLSNGGLIGLVIAAVVGFSVIATLIEKGGMM